MRVQTLRLAFAGLALACSDSTDPGGDGITKPPADLNILRLAATSPPLFNPETTFYAVRGEDREVRISFQDAGGDEGEEYLRLRVRDEALLSYPDGTDFVEGDSVLITVRVVDPTRLLFEFEPAGLTFSPAEPAELKIHYNQADDDLDEDGDVDLEDEALELDLAIWRQEAEGDPFVRLGSLVSIDLEEIDAELSGFSRYALAY
jgi:hypothetical protein